MKEDSTPFEKSGKLTHHEKKKIAKQLEEEVRANNDKKRRFKTSPTETGTAPNQSALADLLGVTRKTIQRWVKEPDFPKQNEEGSWNIEPVKLWAHKHGKKLGSDALPDKTSAQVEQIMLQNRKLEIQIGVLQGNYYDKEEIGKQVSRMVGNLRRVLYGLPATLAPQTVGATIAEAEQLIKDGVDEAFRELHESDWADG